jgi:hypothetical protein
MVAKSKRIKAWIFLAVAVVLGAILMFGGAGTIQYIAFRSGLTAPVQLGTVNIHFREGWYKKVSSEGFIGRMLMKSKDSEVLVAARDGAFRRDSIEVVLTILTPQAWEESVKSREASEKLEEFPWGQARILAGEFIAEIPKYCMTVVVVDWRKGPSVRTVLDAVTRIDHGDGGPPIDGAPGSASTSRCL